jgi:Ca2+-transporting ATPase
MGRIASNVIAQPREQTPLQYELHRVGRVLAIAAGVLCLGVFIIGIARGIDTDKMLLTAASLGVAAIPEGLPAASTVVLALGVQRMASRNALVRRLSSVETLGSVTVIFTDKTGTLTQNRMRVEETWLAGSERDFLNVARFCNNAQLAENGDAHRGDPTEIALLDYVRQRDGLSYSSPGYERRLEVPFTADRARMTVVMGTPDGALLALTKGATGRVLERCSLIGTSPATDELRRQVTDRASEMARSGLRVLALAQRALHEEASDAEQIETGLTLVGLAGMADPLRPEAKDAVRRAREAGIQVVMLTGDQRETAASIGTAVGIEGDITTGGELDQLGPDHLPARLSVTRIFARVTSDHKLQIIRAARRQGHVVAMTGDGVNDAPALRAADIGIAMGIQGTPVAREASDLVLADDNFATIVAAIEEGRTIHANIRRFIHFLLACNTAEIAVVFLLLALAVDPVLTPLQILFVNLLTDGLPALALGVEPAAPGVMQQPPRPRGRGLISEQSFVPIIGLGGAVAFASLAAYWLGRTWEAEDSVASMTFATLVGAQLAVSLVFRSETESVFRLPRNLWLFGALVASLLALLAVFYIPVLQDAFEVQPMSLERWLAVASLSLAPLLAGELVKASGLLQRFDLAPRES